MLDQKVFSHIMSNNSQLYYLFTEDYMIFGLANSSGSCVKIYMHDIPGARVGTNHRVLKELNNENYS